MDFDWFQICVCMYVLYFCSSYLIGNGKNEMYMSFCRNLISCIVGSRRMKNICGTRHCRRTWFKISMNTGFLVSFVKISQNLERLVNRFIAFVVFFAPMVSSFKFCHCLRNCLMANEDAISFNSCQKFFLASWFKRMTRWSTGWATPFLWVHALPPRGMARMGMYI